MRSLAFSLLFLVGLAGCGHDLGHGHSELSALEADYLAEDVIDLMTVPLQAADNAFVGDLVFPDEVLERPRPGNGFTVRYALPLEDRVGLGFGSGEVSLYVDEDAVAVADPLLFSFATTNADVIDLAYLIYYEGEASLTGRPTVVDLEVYLRAVRVGPGAWDVEYSVEGVCDLGATLCDVSLLFAAPGRPRAGIEPGFGDGAALIDDPDVRATYDAAIDWFLDGFDIFGDVGCCALYGDQFAYWEVQ